MALLINFQVLNEILSNVEWRRRFLSAVTYEEARKVVLDYYREKAKIKMLKEPTVKVTVIYCEECDDVFELVEPAEIHCPIDPSHKIQVLETYAES